MSLLQREFAEIGLISPDQEDNYNILWMMRVLLVSALHKFAARACVYWLLTALSLQACARAPR